MIDRRTFLRSTAVSAVAALAPRTLLSAVAKQTPALPDLSQWDTVRAQFDMLSKDRVHFGGFYFVSHPRPVREAIEAYRRAIDAEPFLEVEHRMFVGGPDNLQMKIREDMSGYLGATMEQIALTGNTTTGLALVYAGLPLKPGDEVLTTTHDHYSQHESIRFATEKAGAAMRKVPLYASAPRTTTDEMVGNLRAAIRPATRVVGLTWVHSCTGVTIPVRALADVVAAANRSRGAADRIRMVLDGVHGLGAREERAADLGCDYFCAGTHKWMFAPRGTGLVWASADNWAHLKPTIPTFASEAAWNAWLAGTPSTQPISAFDVTPGGFHAYEHQWGMSAAFRFHDTMGRARVAARIRELNDRCKAGLAALPKVHVVTPTKPELSAGIVCFEVDGLTPEVIAERLLERHIVASASPYLPAYARLSPSLLNTPAEVDLVVRTVGEIARA